MAFSPGDIALALSGRDKGKCFMVISVQYNYLYLCDGKNRKVDTPKKKNIKHVANTGIADNLIADKIARGATPTNKEIRCSLRRLLKESSNPDY